MNKIKEIFLFSFLLVFFLFIIFIFKNYIFISEKEILKEESLINLSLESAKDDYTVSEENLSKILSDLKKKEKEEKIIYNYLPESFVFEEKLQNYKKYLDSFFLSDIINKKIWKLEIILYKNSFEVRWRLKNKKIHIFDIYNQTKEEALSVSIHEFWHFLDLYILKKKVFKDLSEDFYNISWDERNIMKPWNNVFDFVSGYAMTNMYEDFAESFTFYILHNKEFKKRSEKSEKLKRKYEFFRNNIFIKEEFITEYFSFPISDKNIWDTTKQHYDLEKFKYYLQNFDW